MSTRTEHHRGQHRSQGNVAPCCKLDHRAEALRHLALSEHAEAGIRYDSVTVEQAPAIAAQLALVEAVRALVYAALDS